MDLEQQLAELKEEYKPTLAEYAIPFFGFNRYSKRIKDFKEQNPDFFPTMALKMVDLYDSAVSKLTIVHSAELVGAVILAYQSLKH